jgi:hypothetical protein
MTTLLEQAFSAASQLPAEEQDALAKRLLADLAAEREWQRSLAAAPDKLAALADEALAELRAGQTQPLDPDQL